MSLCEGSQQLLLSENADTLPSLLSADSTWHSMKKEHRGAHTKQTNKLKKNNTGTNIFNYYWQCILLIVANCNDAPSIFI